MRKDPETPTAVPVAVGASREDAAAVFGEYFEHVFLTSYDDFDDEVDLGLLGSVGLVAGDGLSAVLPRLLAPHNTDRATPPRVVLGLPPGRSQLRSPDEVLAGCPGVRVAQVLESSGNVLWLLAAEAGPLDVVPEPTAAPTPRLNAPRATGATPAPAPPEAPPEAPTDVRTDPRPGTRTGEPTGGSALPGRRVLLRWAAAALAVAVVLAGLLSLVGRTPLGTGGVVVVAAVVVVLGQLAILLYVARAVQLLRTAPPRNPAAAQDDRLFRRQMRRRSARLLRLARESAQQQEERTAGLARSVHRELTVTRERLTAVTRLLARSGVESREQAAAQLEQHAVTRRHVDAVAAAGQEQHDGHVWAPDAETLAPDFLLACVETLTRLRPTSIMTCGVGEHSAFLVLAAARLDLGAHVVSLEPERVSARKVERLLSGLGLEEHAEVRVGWYDEAVLAGVADVELLVVHVPAGPTDHRGAAATLPVPRDLLAERCTIVLDRRLSTTDAGAAFGWSSLLPDFSLVPGAESAPVTVLRRGPAAQELW